MVAIGATIHNHPLASRSQYAAAEGVVAALLRRPNADTFLNLWVTSRIDIRNGDIFEFLARQPKLRSKEIRRRLEKRPALATALKFLFVPRGGPWPLEDIRGHEARTDGSEATNKENVHYHYDVSNAFYALFLDAEMVYSCAYFRDWNNDLATAQHDKLDMICRKLRLAPGERMLDVGCGWGALACHAAKHYGRSNSHSRRKRSPASASRTRCRSSCATIL